MCRLLKQGVQHVVDDGEQHGGDGVALAQPASMIDGWPRIAVDKDSCGSRGVEDAHPFAPTAPKAEVAKSLKEEGPRYGIKRLRDVELEEYSWGLQVVEQASGLLN